MIEAIENVALEIMSDRIRIGLWTYHALVSKRPLGRWAFAWLIIRGYLEFGDIEYDHRQVLPTEKGKQWFFNHESELYKGWMV